MCLACTRTLGSAFCYSLSLLGVLERWVLVVNVPFHFVFDVHFERFTFHHHEVSDAEHSFGFVPRDDVDFFASHCEPIGDSRVGVYGYFDDVERSFELCVVEAKLVLWFGVHFVTHFLC
jgi:hypothetical protein